VPCSRANCTFTCIFVTCKEYCVSRALSLGLFGFVFGTITAVFNFEFIYIMNSSMRVLMIVFGPRRNEVTGEWK
jgi:hypothetical protein